MKLIRGIYLGDDGDEARVKIATESERVAIATGALVSVSEKPLPKPFDPHAIVGRHIFFGARDGEDLFFFGLAESIDVHFSSLDRTSFRIEGVLL